MTHFLSDSREFQIDVAMRIDKNEYHYSLAIDADTYRVTQEELKAKLHPGQYVFSTRPETGPLEQDPESPVVVARFHKETRGLNPRRDFSPYDFILSQFTSRRAESRVNEDVASAVRREFASIRPLELRPEVLRQYSALGRSDLGEHGENFGAVVWNLVNDATRKRFVRRTGADGEFRLERMDAPPEALQRLEAINAWLGEVTPIPIDSIETVQAPTGEVIFAVREAGYGHLIAAPSLSDGTLRFAALALAAVGAEGRQTLVVEEVENGISPSRLSLLIRMLEQTAGVDEVQVIASTHSPAVLDYASTETIDDSVVIGWDHDNVCSTPISLRNLPALQSALNDRTLGELQAEGWLQLAAEDVGP